MFVIQITSLVILSILTTLVILILSRSKGSLVALDRAIFLGQLTLDQILDVVDQVDAAPDLFLADARVLVGLILVVVHQLVEIGQVCLQSSPRGLHQVLLASYRLARACIDDLIDLIAETLDAFLSFAIVPLELVSAHFVSVLICLFIRIILL